MKTYLPMIIGYVAAAILLSWTFLVRLARWITRRR